MGLLSPTLSSGGGEGEPPDDSRFMVPMRNAALHEPGSEMASSPQPSPPKEREDHLARFGFIVPMHSFAIEEATHEPKTEMGLLSPTLSSGGGEGEPPDDL